MSKAQHTPGPWRWEGVSLLAPNGHQILWPYNIPQSVEDGDPFHIRMGTAHVDTQESAEANARLISAAPDLLAACEELMGRIDANPELQELIGMPECSRAAAAIAKAKGTA